MTTIEQRILGISYRLKLSHIGSCLTAVGIIEQIYANMQPGDKFVLSCGHAHLAHAVVMEKFDVIQDAEENMRLHGIHCSRKAGCDVSTGSLGQGICIALGMALADRSRTVYCLLSDGECSEGSVYEALHCQSKYNVDNLKVYCNSNGWAAYERTYGVFANIENIDTSKHWFMQQYGQEAHYKILTEREYEAYVLQ